MDNVTNTMSDIEEQFQNMSLSTLKVTTGHTDLFRKSLTLVSELADDVNLTFSERGLHVATMDVGHVSLTKLKISRRFFDSYHFSREVVIGMKLSNLCRVLSCIDTSLTIEYSEDEPDVLSLTSEDGHAFKLRALDIDSEDMQIPDAEYEVEIDADAGVFQKYMKNLSIFGDDLTVEGDGNRVHMSSSGEIGNGKIQFDGFRVVVRGTLKASFALKYLVTFSKASAFSKDVSIRCSNELPMKISYSFDTDSYISFYLAPKFDEEDEYEE